MNHLVEEDEYQLLCSAKPWLETSVPLHQDVQKMTKFSTFHEHIRENVLKQGMKIEGAAMKRNSRRNSEPGDLLNEFPAETRLTVYRRLDIIPNRGEIARPWTREDP